MRVSKYMQKGPWLTPPPPKKKSFSGQKMRIYQFLPLRTTLKFHQKKAMGECSISLHRNRRGKLQQSKAHLLLPAVLFRNAGEMLQSMETL
jgi:hypothetical protein